MFGFPIWNLPQKYDTYKMFIPEPKFKDKENGIALCFIFEFMLSKLNQNKSLNQGNQKLKFNK